MKKWSFLRFTALLMVLGLVAAACNTIKRQETTGGDEGAEGGSVVVYLSDPTTLDPGFCSTVLCFEIIQRLFDPLINYDPETSEPVFDAAAESVEVSDDAKTITFQLREDATFHNGDPVNAEAFVRGLTRVAATESASEISYHLDGIVGFGDVEKVTDDLAGVHEGSNEFELVIELTDPNAEFFIRTGHTVFSPVPEQAVDDPEGFALNPTGNGPYEMNGAMEPNEMASVMKWGDYTGSQPGILDEITWQFFEEVDTAYLEFEAGNLDSTSVPPEQFAAAAEAFGDGFIDQPDASLTYLGANLSNDATGNALFRQGLSLGIDRASINTAVFNGQRSPAVSLVPPATAGFRPDACEYCVYDLDMAKAKITESGIDTSTEIELTFNSGAGHDEWVEAVASGWRDGLGLTVTVKPGSAQFGPDAYFKDIAEVAGFYRLGWGQDYPSADNWLFPLLFSESGDNFAGYANDDFDAKIREAQGTLDDADRLALYQEAEDMALEDMPLIPIFNGRSAQVYDAEKFANFVVDAQLGLPVWELISLNA